MRYKRTICRACGAPELAKGMCKKHYHAKRRSELSQSRCIVQGCDRPQHARRLCGTHYHQQRLERGLLQEGHSEVEVAVVARIPRNVFQQLHSLAKLRRVRTSRMTRQLLIDAVEKTVALAQ